MAKSDKNSQIKSKKRVKEHGEVFTNEREVKAMLDMVPVWSNANQATGTQFLEPACGDGNFLAEIVQRKMDLILKSRKPNYKKDQPAFEKEMLVAVGAVYGIDIMLDNTKECVARLYHIITDIYEKTFKDTFSEDVEHCVRFILSRNIVCGDALSMRDYKGNPIRFSEWNSATRPYQSKRLLSYRQSAPSAFGICLRIEPGYLAKRRGEGR